MKNRFVCLAFSLLASTASAQVQDPETRPEEFGAQASQTTPAAAEPGSSVAGQTYQIAPPAQWLGTPSHSEYVSDYPGSRFHVTGMAVGRLTSNQPPTIAGQAGYSAACTAWLVARDLILTARHCIRGAAGGVPTGQVLVQFGFDYGAAMTPTYAVSRIEEADDGLDYVLARVTAAAPSPLPGDIYGVIRVAGDGDIRDKEPLLIVHHANGDSQLLIKDGTCRRFSPATALSTNLYHRCDTREGSSGAPIMSFVPGFLPAAGTAAETVAIALHTRGGSLDTPENFKVATRMSAIVAASPLLRPLSCRWNLGRWRCPSLTRPATTLRVIPFPQRETYLQRQPGPFGDTFSDAVVQQAFQNLTADLGPASGLIRIRVLGDATLDDVDSAFALGSPLVAEALRRRVAYQRAEDVAGHIRRALSFDRPYVVEVDHRRNDPGSDPRPARAQTEVFIDVVY